MKFTTSLIAVLLFSSQLWAQSFASYSCIGSEASPKLVKQSPLSEFTKNFLEADITDLNPFVASWVNATLDPNGDQTVDPSEVDRAVCTIQKSLRLALPSLRPGEYVSNNGRTDLLAYEAGLNTLSGYKLKMAMAIYARSWLIETLRTEDAELNSKIYDLISSGGYSVAAKTPEEQVDLMGVDRTEFGQMEKQQNLGFQVAEWIQVFGPEFPKLKNKILTAALSKRSFPYAKYKGKDAVTVAFNTVTPSSFGVDGAKRYYVLFGTGLTLNMNKADVWGQPSQQKTMILTSADAYPKTDKYYGQVQRKLQKICLAMAPSERRLADGKAFDAQAIQSRLQVFADQLSDAFMEDSVEIEVSEAGLTGADFGHHDVAAGRISISGSEIKDMLEKADLESQNRYFQFLLVHEYIHFLQGKGENYAMNLNLYNSPQDANLLYGTHGYTELYLKQPLEYDAQTLAADFVDCAAGDKMVQFN